MRARIRARSVAVCATLFCLGCLLLLGLTGCTAGDRQIASDKINVVTSFYPLYDFTRKLGGDRVHVINLVPAGVEPHDWTPKSGDIRVIKQSQMLVYQGAGFEGWIGDFLKTVPANSGLRVVKASQNVDLLQTGEGAVDPHLWLSPHNAKRMAESIKNGLVSVDPAHAEEYEANFRQLSGRFDALDAKYRQEIGSTPGKDIVVSHQAFGYLCRDYGLNQKAIMGLSPEAEPTAHDIKHMIDFIRANRVHYIFFEELVSDSLAKMLSEDTGVQMLPLNPLEGLTKAQIKAGDDYFSVMERNLQNLLKALQ